MFLGCVVYPSNWTDQRIASICETSGRYASGKCRIKWAYILAIIGIFDILLLGILALVLSQRQATNYKIASVVKLTDETTNISSTEIQNNIVVSEAVNEAFSNENNLKNHRTEYSETNNKIILGASNEENSFRDFQI